MKYGIENERIAGDNQRPALTTLRLSIKTNWLTVSSFDVRCSSFDVRVSPEHFAVALGLPVIRKKDGTCTFTVPQRAAPSPCGKESQHVRQNRSGRDRRRHPLQRSSRTPVRDHDRRL